MFLYVYVCIKVVLYRCFLISYIKRTECYHCSYSKITKQSVNVLNQSFWEFGAEYRSLIVCQIYSQIIIDQRRFRA